MHADETTVLGSAPERAKDRRVVDHEHAGIRHEELERGHAARDELIHLGEALVVELANDAVKAVVDRGLTARLFLPRLDGRGQRLAERLHREVDDRGCPAESRRRGAGLEIVRGERAAERQLHVRVHIDASRDHVSPGRVDLLRAIDGQIAPACDIESPAGIVPAEIDH